jgi:hypothetical protein
MVFLNVNSAQNVVPCGFRPTTNYNYTYIPPGHVQYYDANQKYRNHFYEPYSVPL